MLVATAVATTRAQSNDEAITEVAVEIETGAKPESTAGTTAVTTGLACHELVTIMPLGDSITRGDGTGSDPFASGDEYGYRYYLYNSLVAAGYYFDFVGSEQGGGLDGLIFDYDHEGHPGYRADWIANRIDNYLNRRHPDVVLLHIGTNDIAQGQGDSPEDIENILNTVALIDSEVIVVLALIVDQNPTNPNYQSVATFNANLTAMVQAHIANGEQIILVDMQNALTYPDDMSDWLHPNDSGYQKMAEVWFNALQTVLPLCPFKNYLPIIQN
jgi:lysophospholipase L1-like esterase